MPPWLFWTWARASSTTSSTSKEFFEFRIKFFFEISWLEHVLKWGIYKATKNDRF
jgi:hypothetical protein